LEEDRFAADAADMLKQRALRGDFESLIIVAPPRTLGELRKHYHKEVQKRLTGEIAKDLTGHPVEEIERIIQAQ
jgi:protein required for attachment to host cells